MGHRFVCSPAPKTSPNRRWMYPRCQIISSASRKISLLPEIVTWKLRRGRPVMRIRNDKRSRITRLGTRFIWKPRIYDYALRREGALNFTFAMSVHSRSRTQSQLPRITRSNYHLNFEFTPKFMLDD